MTVLDERPALARLAERGWLAATDTSSEATIESVGLEAVYKLGFLNGVQAVVIGANATDPEQRGLLAGAIADAAELIEEEAGA